MLITQISLVMLICGQIGFKAISYYTGISGLAVLFFSIVYFYTAARIVRDIDKIRVLDVDYLFLSFLGISIVSYLAIGRSDSLAFTTYITAFVFGPYVAGRVLGRWFTWSSISIIYFCVIAYAALLLFEFVKNPAVFLDMDRVVLFSDDLSEAEVTGSTSHFIGFAFGYGATIAISRLLYKRFSNYEKRILWADTRVATIIFATSVLVLMVSGSKAAQVALLLLCIILFFRFWSLTNFLVMVALCVSLILVYSLLGEARLRFFEELWSSFSSLSQYQGCVLGSEGGSVIARMTLYSESFRLISDSPFFGVGSSNFGLSYCGPPGEFGSPHSMLLHVLVETGLVGFSVFVMFLVAVIRRILLSFSRAQTKLSYVVGCIWIFSFIVEQFSGNYFYDFSFYLITGMFLSISIAERSAACSAPLSSIGTRISRSG